MLRLLIVLVLVAHGIGHSIGVAGGGALLAGLDAWRALALASSVVSLVAIALFPQQLPAFSTVAAVVVDLAVMIGLLVLEWPSADAVGA